MTSNNKKIIAIIPARGGSKRIPRKNIKPLAGRPLISYTINAALSSKYLERVIVSTEDKEIAQISQEYGAEIIKRPRKLASDKATNPDVVLHALTVLERENYLPDVVVLLQPTSPLKTAEDIDKAISAFIKNKCESVFSVSEIHPSPFWSFKKERGYLNPLLGRKYLFKRSQDLPKTYVHNGAICVSTPKVIKKYRNFYASEIIPYIMPPERSIDIDEEIDFNLAELIIKKWRQ